MMTPFVVGRESSVRALEEANATGKQIFLATQHDASVDEPRSDEIYTTGTVANIVQSLKQPDGNIKVLVEGVERGKIVSVSDEDGFYRAVVKTSSFRIEGGPQLDALVSRVTTQFEQYVKLSQNLNYETMVAAIRPNLQLTIEEKQELLEIFDPIDRLTRVAEMLDIEIEKLQVDRTIQGRVKRQMERAQKEYYLNEKIKAIQKELGRGEKSEYDELKKKIELAGMPKDAFEKSMSELRRLENMPPMSAESTVSRNYLDWLLAVPWKKASKEIRDLNFAKEILESDHYGLDKIKERILEFLAVRRLVEKPKGSILCFVGPPGVGKTSLGMSIAKATGREFVRLSLGGVRDEAEIRGHRRTYIGALPGQVIQMMKKAGTKNPVVMLDEIDKMSMDFRGDPSAALLEVLDPAQNSSFQDHYLDVEYDLSNVLQDRMEVIRLSGYTELEKLEIARRFLVPKQLEGTGLKLDQIEFEDSGLATLINGYTRESGVRNLEREIGNVCRKVVRSVVMSMPTEGPDIEEAKPAKKAKGRKKADIVDIASKEPAKEPTEAPVPIEFKKATITEANVNEYLGPAKYRDAVWDKKNEIGSTTGLAWTEVGGTILTTEVSIVEGRGKLTTTGKLGDVMQESAQAALTYVRSRAHQLGLPRDFYRHVDIHVHVPEGAIPKDGPSAGITLATSISSALSKIPVRGDIAMTGEITLRGKVLPIGGLKEKLLAAHRFGILEAILPKDNEKDLVDIPDIVKKNMKLHFVEHMDEVLKLALEREPVGIPHVALDYTAKPAEDIRH